VIQPLIQPRVQSRLVGELMHSVTHSRVQGASGVGRYWPAGQAVGAARRGMGRRVDDRWAGLGVTSDMHARTPNATDGCQRLLDRIYCWPILPGRVVALQLSAVHPGCKQAHTIAKPSSLPVILTNAGRIARRRRGDGLCGRCCWSNGGRGVDGRGLGWRRGRSSSQTWSQSFRGRGLRCRRSCGPLAA